MDSYNNIIGGDNIFEINDFTVVTEFEVLTLTLENAIQEMRTEAELLDIEENEPNYTKTCRREILSSKCVYRNYELQIEYFTQRNRMPKLSDGFTDIEDHPYLCEAALALVHSDIDFFEKMIICKQYGILTDFFLVHIIGQNNFMTESTVNIIQSALNLASLNTDCAFPIFFQFARGASVGVLQNRNFLTSFEGGVLNNCLPSQKYLEGVIKMFKEKLNVPFGIEEKIKISLQHDFYAKLGPSSDISSAAAVVESTSSEIRRLQHASVGCQCSHKYPFQTVGLSLAQGLRVAAIWVDVDEYLLADTENYTNIDPESAQRWKCSVLFDDEFSYEQSYLFTRLFELSEEELSECSVKSQLLPTSGQQLSLGTTALGPLINKPMTRDIKILEDLSSNDESDWSDCVRFILKGNENGDDLSGDDELTSEQQQIFQKFSNFKSAPVNSLTRRLAVCLVKKIEGNFANFCRLWFKCLQILRHHWEYNLDLPNFGIDERPQLSCCLLHQKLQMFQFCISVKKRKHKEMEATETATLGGIAKEFATNRNTADEEFFDANESFGGMGASTLVDGPRGRSHPFDSDECLREYPMERIFVPITQEEGPMTEDQIEQRESFLSNLEDANMRTKAQSQLLLSDMQAFKAANPGCVLEDFLRWHSPRDLTEEGELSERMKLPGNFWQETWDSASAIPAAQQQRIFNETREVEQILQYFMNIRVKELAELLLPVVSVNMAEVLLRNATECLDLVGPKLDKLCTELNVATKTGDMDAYFVHTNLNCLDSLKQDVGHTLRMVEEMLMKYSSTINLVLEQAPSTDLLKDNELRALRKFVANLCESSNVLCDESSLKSVQLNCEIPDAPYGPIFVALRSFFLLDENNDLVDKDGEWPKPTRKQTIIRSFVPHPGSGSRAMPQRMYTSYSEEEFVFCGSFTSDITFI